MTQYLGLDLLDVMPDRSDVISDSVEQLLEILDPGAGPKFYDHREKAPRWNRTVRWHLFGLDDMAVLRTFLDARLGRTVPFWLPSLEVDLEVHSTIFSWAQSFRIKHVGYAETIYPLGGMRRHFYLRNPDGAVGAYRATSALDLGDGSERIYVGGQFIAQSGTPAVSYLRYCRLGQDLQTITWQSPGAAVCDMPVVEIPAEAPE